MPTPPRPETADRTTTTWPEALAIAALCFGWSVWAAIASVGQRPSGGGFTDAALVVSALFEVLVAAAALAFLARRGYALRALVPVPTWRDSALGAALYAGCWLASAALLAPLAADYADEPIARMMAATHVHLPAVALFSLVNAAYEEVFLVGVLMRGLRGLGASTALGLVVLLRILCHVYQGPVGVLSVFLFGLAFGLVWLRTQRLWVLVAAHVLWDFVPLTFATGAA